MTKERKTCQISRIERYTVDETGERKPLDIHEPINLSRDEAKKVLSREDITDEVLTASDYLHIKRMRTQKNATETELAIRIEKRKKEEQRIKQKQRMKAHEAAKAAAERDAKKRRKQQAIDELTAEFIDSRKKQGLDYRQIRVAAFELLSAVQSVQKEEAKYTLEHFDIITTALSNAADVATNKYNNSLGEFTPIEPAKTLSK